MKRVVSLLLVSSQHPARATSFSIALKHTELTIHFIMDMLLQPCGRFSRKAIDCGRRDVSAAGGSGKKTHSGIALVYLT